VETQNILDEISSMFGRCQDLRDAYSAAEGEYSQVWLSENRPYWLKNVTIRYDLAIQKWQQRSDMFLEAIRDWQDGKEPAAHRRLPAVRSAACQMSVPAITANTRGLS